MCKVEPADTREYKGYKILIYQDDNPGNPRDWDNLGKMVCFHRNYKLGDKHDLSVDDLKETVKRKDVIALPLYLLDHSGLWMRTVRFLEDPQGWDTSAVGYIFVDFATIRKEYSVKRISRKLRRKVEDVLEQEVQTYSQYLSGEVYGYSARNARGEVVDSCWGFYGDEGEKDMVQEAQTAIDYAIQEEALQNALDHALEIGEELCV